MPLPIIATTVVVVAVCVAFDVQTRRIPNAVNGAALALGLLLNWLYGGSAGLVASFTGALLPLVLLLLPFALGGIGGGDVKMMAALGALVGPRLALWGLVLGMIIGGGIMIVHLGRLGRLREKLRATGSMLAVAATTGSVDALRVPSAATGAVALPYSVPLGLGTLIVLAGSGVVR